MKNNPINSIVNVPGNRVLIRLEKLEKKETFEGSCLIRPDLTDSKHKLEQEAIYKGHVMSLGPDAYADCSVPWCSIGDFVQFSKYSGTLIEDDELDSKHVYRMINDKDVHAGYPKKGIK
jgi:co-chaperonin GroES (HSP10)